MSVIQNGINASGTDKTAADPSGKSKVINEHIIKIRENEAQFREIPRLFIRIFPELHSVTDTQSLTIHIRSRPDKKTAAYHRELGSHPTVVAQCDIALGNHA
jgi:hypothetical protein